MTDNANISPADKAALMAAKQGCLVMHGQNETSQPDYVMNGIHMTPEGAEKYVAAFEQRIALLEEGARAEREAVVKWLRAGTGEVSLFGLTLAQAIEDGEHVGE